MFRKQGVKGREITSVGGGGKRARGRERLPVFCCFDRSWHARHHQMGNLPIQAGVQLPFKWFPGASGGDKRAKRVSGCRGKKRASHGFLARTKEFLLREHIAARWRCTSDRGVRDWRGQFHQMTLSDIVGTYWIKTYITALRAEVWSHFEVLIFSSGHLSNLRLLSLTRVSKRGKS